MLFVFGYLVPGNDWRGPRESMSDARYVYLAPTSQLIVGREAARLLVLDPRRGHQGRQAPPNLPGRPAPTPPQAPARPGPQRGGRADGSAPAWGPSAGRASRRRGTRQG